MNKIILSLAMFFIASSGSANETSNYQKMKLVCNEYDRGTEKILQKTFVLIHLDKKEVTDGANNRFVFEMYKGAKTYPEFTASGTVETEDVYFFFQSDDKKVEVSLYLDEMNETELGIDGKKVGDYICR